MNFICNWFHKHRWVNSKNEHGDNYKVCIKCRKIKDFKLKE